MVVFLEKPADNASPDGDEVSLGPLSRSLGYVLNRAQMANYTALVKAFSEHDIRPAAYSVLSVISANGELSNSQVSDTLGIRRANFVNLCRDLEDQGLISRRRDVCDKRSFLLTLTEKGSDLLLKLAELERAHINRMTSLMSKSERQTLCALLKKFASANELNNEPPHQE